MGGETMKNVVTFSIVTIAATLLATIMAPAIYAGNRNNVENHDKEKTAAKM
jgi:hypothetical protein